MFKLSSIITLLFTLVSAEKCPAPQSIQSDAVKNTFNITQFLGTYYEIAYHDYTQPTGVCGC